MGTNDHILIPQAEYVKTLRPLLPAEAFIPDPKQVINSGY